MPELKVDQAGILNDYLSIEPHFKWMAEGTAKSPYKEENVGKFQTVLTDFGHLKHISIFLKQFKILPRQVIFLRCLPNQVSSIHQDILRRSAINVTVSTEYDITWVEFYEKRRDPGAARIKEHIDHIPWAIDTDMFHRVVNVGSGVRITLTLGFPQTYDELVKLYKEGTLLDL